LFKTAYIALGSNVGDRFQYLQKATSGFSRHAEIQVIRVSPVYESEAHTVSPEETQYPYLNAVLGINTSLSPLALMRSCLQLEQNEGRVRDPRRRWTPRTLDLDILVYDRVTVSTDDLVIPHPRLGERRFVLLPLHVIRQDLYVPYPFDATVDQLLLACPDSGRLKISPYKLRQ